MTTYLNNEQVLELATKLHEGQVRRDGKPYITHPIAVSKMVSDIQNTYLPSAYVPFDVSGRLEQAALLHDVMEDCFFVDEKYLLDAGVDPIVVEYCKDLNKENFPSYLSMLRNLIKKRSPAIYVKLADMKHNLSENPGKAKDKYELAIALLENALENMYN